MIELFQKKDFSRLSEITYIAALPFAVLAVLSDVLITLALCVLLYNSRTGFRSTNSMLNLIIVYAINRCLLTSIVATIEMVMFVTEQETLWYLAADFVVGKLYVNSLLATLNTRSALAGKGMENDESTEMTNASFHIGNVTQSIILDRQNSPRRRFDSIKKTEVSGNEVVSVSMVDGPSDSKDTTGSGSKHSGSKRSVNLARGSSGSKDASSGSNLSGSKHSGSKQSGSLVREPSGSKDSTGSGSKRLGSAHSGIEPPPGTSEGSAHSIQSSLSSRETVHDKVEVSIRSAVQSSSSGRSDAKASTVAEETHMIDV